MLNFQNILTTYPTLLQSRKEHIYKEYLQYHILEWIFDAPYSDKVCFIWGTALRLCYGNSRFSEDLDFDNTNLSYEEFDSMMEYVANSLELKWFTVETRLVRKWAYHYYFKFPELLYDAWLSPMRTSKILIQIDTHDQWVKYVAKNSKLSAFEVNILVSVASINTLLAQKLYTVFERKRMKWRDFFDILFLLKKTQQPDRHYLNKTLDINDPTALKNRLLTNCEGLDFKRLQADVAPFLFQPQNQSVINFVKYIEQIDFQK